MLAVTIVLMIIVEAKCRSCVYGSVGGRGILEKGNKGRGECIL